MLNRDLTHRLYRLVEQLSEDVRSSGKQAQWKLIDGWLDRAAMRIERCLIDARTHGTVLPWTPFAFTSSTLIPDYKSAASLS